MAEPKKRLTSARSGKRRSHISPKKIILNQCPKCKSPIIAHRVCKTCGFYKNVDVLRLEEKERVKEERRKAEKAEEKGETK